jgi:hypothetical protein
VASSGSRPKNAGVAIASASIRSRGGNAVRVMMSNSWELWMEIIMVGQNNSLHSLPYSPSTFFTIFNPYFLCCFSHTIGFHDFRVCPEVRLTKRLPPAKSRCGHRSPNHHCVPCARCCGVAAAFFFPPLLRSKSQRQY